MIKKLICAGCGVIQFAERGQIHGIDQGNEKQKRPNGA